MIQGVWKESMEFHPEKRIDVENSGGRLSSDAGLLIVRECDEHLKLTEQFAGVLEDDRGEAKHSLLSMVRQRVYGIIAGYEDQNDHDTLRHDPVFQTVCDRIPDDAPEVLLASQPTLSRFDGVLFQGDRCPRFVSVA